MNKKFVIFVGIILLLTAGISFAALLDYYGIIIGTAEVSPLEFYIGSAKENNETLLINEKSPDCASFKVQNVYRTFKTKELVGVNFNYLPKAKFFLRGHVIATTTPQDLILSWGYFDTSDVGETNPHYLCTTNISLTNNMENYTSDFVECSEVPVGVKRFFYEIKKGCEDCDYTIKKCADGFYTKVELSK